MKVKCYYCGKEINAFDLASTVIKGRKVYCHTGCYSDNLTKNILQHKTPSARKWEDIVFE